MKCIGHGYNVRMNGLARLSTRKRESPIRVYSEKDSGLQAMHTAMKIDRFQRQIATDKGVLIINSIDEKNVLPGGFRISSIVSMGHGHPINVTGLESLHISGSSQFSELSLEAIKQKVYPRHMTVVNLRQEDEVFIEPKRGNGAIPCSWMMSLPWWVGSNRTAEEIDQSERRRAEELQHEEKVKIFGVQDDVNLTKDAHILTYKMTVRPRHVFTEKELAEKEGMGYFRIPDKKFGHMQFEHVDQFVQFVKGLPEGEHLHFHCRRGQSRTTLFMAMYDMMRNADRVEAREIVERQGPSGLGGVDLEALPDQSAWDFSFKKGWRDFMHQFHAYCRENIHAGFHKSFSIWVKEQGIQEPSCVEVSLDYRGPTVLSEVPDNEEVLMMKTNPLVSVTLNEGKLPFQNFRSTQDLWLDSALAHSTAGLHDMRLSGSSQFSEVGIDLFMKKIAKQDPSVHVVILDVRQDEHLFVNGQNASLFQKKDELVSIRGLEAEKRSLVKLKRQLEGASVRLRALTYRKEDFDPCFSLRIKVKRVETPDELVRRKGADYIRMPYNKYIGIDDASLSHLIESVESAPTSSWFHVFCRNGRGRTTFFMTLIDIIHHADTVPFEEIVRRQHFIGGINLFDITPKDSNWMNEMDAKKERIVLLARFHRYVREEYLLAKREGRRPTSWQEWSQVHRDERPNVDHLVFVKTE